MSSSHHGIVQDAAEDALMHMVGWLAIALPLASLVQVLANLHDYRQPAVAIVVWLAMFPVARWLVPRIRTGGLTRGQELAAILIAVAAVAVIGWEHRTLYAVGRVDLAVLGAAWLLGLLVVTSPARVWITGALAVFAVHSALLIDMTGTNQLVLTQLEAAAYVTATVLLAFNALRPTMTVHARISAHRAWLASRSAAEQAAAAAVLQDRRDRLALLEVETLPLLRAIADGTLNPADDEVRDRCAQQAAAMRHSLVDRAPRADGLLSGLDPVLKAADARGLVVDVRVIGDPGVPPPAVGQAIAATVERVLGALPPHQVVLTVLAPGDDAELYVTFTEALAVTVDMTRFGQRLPAAVRWRAIIAGDESGAGYLQISWRKAVLLDPRD
jgi:hypothetical protein